MNPAIAWLTVIASLPFATRNCVEGSREGYESGEDLKCVQQRGVGMEVEHQMNRKGEIARRLDRL